LVFSSVFAIAVSADYRLVSLSMQPRMPGTCNSGLTAQRRRLYYQHQLLLKVHKVIK